MNNIARGHSARRARRHGEVPCSARLCPTYGASMGDHRLKIIAVVILAAFAILSPSHAGAQDALRDKTIRIIVPFPPGGSADTLARIVTQQATQAAGQRFVIENRPGAGTIIGTEAVARSAPDGTTLLMMSNSFVINGIVRASLPYDPMAFEPVCFLVDSPQVLVVNDTSPWRSLKDLVDAAKAQPGELSYVSMGPPPPRHTAVDLLDDPPVTSPSRRCPSGSR